MIHRAPFGSLERFIAVLIEHTGGNFPLWLAPDQIAVLPISEKFHGYSDKIFSKLQANGITGFIDHRDEKISRKIRDAEVKKTPFMIIAGEKEMLEGKISVRKHGEGDVGTFSIPEFLTYFEQEKDKSLHKNEVVA
jgi:threonyl-tRNA synthetase